MVIYWSLLLWVFFVGLAQPNEHNPLLNNHADGYKASWKLALVLMVPVIFLAAVRYAPIDTTTYIEYYIRIPLGMSHFKEYMSIYTDSHLYYGIQMWFKNTFQTTYIGWFTLLAVVQGGCVLWMLKKHSTNMAMSVYIYMASTMFTWMYNGVRQYLAVAILFALSDCIVKNRWYIYIPVALMLGGIAPFCEMMGLQEPEWYLQGVHQSALMMIPLFFFVQGKAFNWKMLVFVAGFIGLLLTGSLDSVLESTVEVSAFGNDVEQIVSGSGAHPLRAVMPMVPVVLALLKKNEIDGDETVPKMIHICINMSIVTVALYVASVFTSGVFVGRLAAYTELYNLILLPWLIQKLYKKEQQTWTYGVYGAYLGWFVYQMHIAWQGLSYASEWLGIYFYGGTR